MDLSEGTGLIT